MSVSNRVLSLVVVLAMSLFIGSSATHAAPIFPFGTLYPAPAEAGPSGGVVLDTMSVPVVTPSFTGTLTSTVIVGDINNALGGLTFTFHFENDVTSTHPVGRLTVNGYDGWLTDASYETPFSGVFPALINRPVGDVIGFTFMDIIGPGLIGPGKESSLLVVRTNAPDYTENLASVIDGFVDTVPTFAPIPEPGTLAMLGLVGFGLFIRRVR